MNKKRIVRRVILEIVIIAVATYVVVAVWMYISQSRVVFQPTRELSLLPDQVGLDYEPVSLKTADGLKLSAWFVPAKEQKGVLLFCHGNGGNMSHRLESIKLFHGLGLGVLIFDYRGYGESEGRPTEAGTYRDAEAAWDYLVKTRNVPPGRIVIFGRSLGGAVAAHLAKANKPRALILESTFTSVGDLGAHHLPYLPVRLLSRFRYSAVDYVRQVNCPILVVHSRGDDIVPFRLGQRVYEAAREPKTFLEIQGDHNYGFVISGSLYTDGLADFIASTREGAGSSR